MLYYGADYYPEHWPESRWPTDARLMQEAGFNLVRLGEFAWSRLEPAPGRYDFAWLDRAIDLLAAHGMRVVLGTPTASPPPWLMAQHPDAFLVREDGLRATYGHRRCYCPSNPAYRERTAAIVGALARHYGAHPHILAWQIDNEFGSRCYCEHCRQRFHEWLRARYGTLDALNEAWGTVFWSQEYTDWTEIPLPAATGGVANPSLALDYRRFMSDLYVEYQALQIGELRPYSRGQLITHNLMGFGYEGLNYYDLARPLDLVSWDNYPRGFWATAQEVDPAAAALSHDAMRGLKGASFWVMEEQSGPSGWETMGAAPRPGEVRLWAYQALAHGADAIVYFRWRTCRFGTEQLWHGILDHDGRPRRRYEEVKQTGQELARLAAALAGTSVKAEVALIHCYDSRFAFQVQPGNPGFRYAGHALDLYRALHRRNVAADVVPPTADLSGYRLVLAPALHVVTPEVAENLERYVQQGGTLLLTARSGVKTATNTVVDLPLPGLLARLAGAEVEEYDSLPAGAAQPLAFAGPLAGRPPAGQATVWCEALAPRGAEVLASYASGWLAGRPAATRHRHGAGQAIYLGTCGDAVLLQALVDWLLAEAKVHPALAAPEGVEATLRQADGRQLLFLLNHTSEPREVALDGAWRELIGDRPARGLLRLEARGVAILEKA